jgi:outer membrane autotransporter protein
VKRTNQSEIFQQNNIMKRRKLTHVSEPRNDLNHHRGPSRGSCCVSSIGVSVGFAIASFGVLALSGIARGQAVSLGDARNFGIISSQGVTSTGFSVVNGNVGLSPLTTITGFNFSTPSGPGLVNGTVYYNDATAINARNHAMTAYNSLAGLAYIPANDLTGLDLGGMTLAPGVYHFDTSAQLTGALTLATGADPNAIYVFQIGSTLTTATDASVIVTGAGSGLTPNIFWQVGSSATLNTGTAFTGNILALASVSFLTNTQFTNGRAMALNGAVTLDSNTLTSPVQILAAPGRFWNGANSNLWSEVNWSTTVAGLDQVALGSDVDAVFSVNPAPINQDTILDSDVTISSLTVNDTAEVTIGNPIGLTNKLAISATGLVTGININDGAGLITIDSNLELGYLSQIVTVDNEAGLVINGIISGTNGLTKSGAGILTLTGAEIYTGATIVSEGTLQLGDGMKTGASIALSDSVFVAGDGVLALNLAGGETFTNSVTNNGEIQWIADVKNTQSSDSVFSGTGIMLVKAPGTTVLLGANTFSGGTMIGTTNPVDATGEIFIGNPLAFGTGVLTINNGSIDTVNSESFEIEVGGYEQTGGEIRMHLGGTAPGTYTRYDVEGDVILDGGAVYVYTETSGYIPQGGDQQNIIHSGTEVNGQFASNSPDSLFYNPDLDQFISYRQGSTLLYPTITYDPNDVFVTWVQDAFASLIDLTPNQTAVANSIDAGDAPSHVVDYLNTQNITLLPGIYDLIAPDELTAIYQMGFTSSEIQNTNIKRHLERVRQGSSTQTQYTQTLTDSKGGMVQQETMMMSDSKRWTAFFEGTDGSVSIEGDYNSSGYDFDIRGANLGADYRVSDRLSVGIMGSYADSNASLINGGSIEAESFNGAIYATCYDEAFYVDALLGSGYHSYDTRRDGLLGVTEGSTNAWEIDAILNTGYDIKMGSWTCGPTASVAYTRMMLDGFTETGSLAPLDFPSQHQDSFRTEIGGKIAYNADFNGMRIIPQVRLAWQHEFIDSKQAMESSFVGGTGSTFIVHGPDMDRDRAVLSAGLTVQIMPTVSVYGFYDGHVGSSDYKSNQVTVGVKIDF